MEQTLPKTPLEGDLRLGNLEVRLAETTQEIHAAQCLRYRVFFEEMGAEPSSAVAAEHRDFDTLDEFCDHLLVIDHDKKGSEAVVGTYRLTRREAAEKHGSFYSVCEFDIHRLLELQGEIMELGRSCIHADYRTSTVMQLLWRGVVAYVMTHNVQLMFGCASFHGTDIEELKIPLSYLYHHHLAPPALRAKALPVSYVDMNILPRAAFDPNQTFNALKLDPRSGSNSLPPLIKGYLRVGAFVGEGAYLDKPFNTTDVCIIVKTDLITSRYIKHYERAANKEET